MSADTAGSAVHFQEVAVTEHAPYKLNLNKGRPNVLHKHPSFEQCNADDADRLVYLDEGAAKEVIKNKTATGCEYCFPAAGL